MNNHFKVYPIIILGLVFFCISYLVGCGANPLNQATYYRYVEQGSAAMDAGNWGGAEIAFSRALTNVDWGNLSQKDKSRALYYLGSVKHVLGKYDEATDYLEQALAIEEKLYGADSLYAGYIVIELAINDYKQAITDYKQGKIDEGIEFLHRLEASYLKSPEGYTQSYKGSLKRLFNKYAEELYKLGREAEAEQLKSFATGIIIPDQ